MRRLLPATLTLTVAGAAWAQALPVNELETRTKEQAVAERSPETDRTLQLIGELGTALAKGNTDTFHINGDVRVIIVPATDWVLETRARALYEKSREIVTANSWSLSERVDRFVSQRFSIFAAGEIARNPFAGLDRRLSGQLGAAYLAWETRDAEKADLVTNRLRLELGGYGAREDFVLPPNSEPDAVLDQNHRKIYAARAAAHYLHALSKTATTGVDVEYIQDFVDTSNVVVNSSVYVAASIAEGFALKLTASHHFENAPPVQEPALKKSDYLLTAGLVVSL